MNTQLWLSLWWVYRQMGCDPQIAGLRATMDERRETDKAYRQRRKEKVAAIRKRRQEYMDLHSGDQPGRF